MRITPEFYSLSLEQSGSMISDIDVTSSDNVRLNIRKILTDGTNTVVNTPVSIDIFDDVSGQIVYSGSYNPSSDTLPIAIIDKI